MDICHTYQVEFRRFEVIARIVGTVEKAQNSPLEFDGIQYAYATKRLDMTTTTLLTMEKH